MIKKFLNIIFLIIVANIFNYASCKYGFKDPVTIDANIKNFRLNQIQNKARYVNTQLAPQLTDKLRLKIISNTKLRQVADADANYDITCTITRYEVSTQGVTGNLPSTNRLTVGVKVLLKNNIDPKKNIDADIMRTFDFSGNQSLQTAEQSLLKDILDNVSSEIFNKLFVNW